ncbi:VOC family protein [Patulibacter sp.]|uniref:VOC family protein n=1 Tax=Patulibacter sp. TaxID=1912859 RepID=UPI00271BF3F7|nr:VOC family protein [Patulibacter sp.]MDO9410815.1 VOC family protein [Patulibacter sp.]
MSTFTPGHVGLNVTDLDRSRGFYEAVFGFECVQESPSPERRFAFLGEGGQVVLTLWQQSDGRFPTDRPGLHHLAFEVADVAAVHAAESRVRATGATLLHDGVVPHGEGTSSGGIFFEDPDGIRLEIYAPVGADERLAPDASAPTCGFF